MAPTRSFRQRTPETSAMQHSRYLKASYTRGLWRPGTGLVWYWQHEYFLLAHYSLVALVDRLPSRLAGILLVKHFHLRVPKSCSIMYPEERTHEHEATLSHVAYLVVALKAQFCLYGNAYPPTLTLLSQAWYRISVVLATQISPF